MKSYPMQMGAAALVAAILVSVAMLPQARGELVLEAPLQEEGEARVDNRESGRQTVRVSEKAIATRSVEAAEGMGVPPTAPVQVEVQHLSRPELMRRERMRAEMKNEDILQERLEELRLRDEKQRTDQLLGVSLNNRPTEASVPVAAPMQEVVIGNAMTSASAVVAPTGGFVVAAAPTSLLPVQQDQIAVLDSDRATLSVQGRGGVSQMSGAMNYDIRPRYSAGVSLGVGASDAISFDLGYTYSEYGVALASTNPYVLNYQAWAGNLGYGANSESVALKQNVVDAGLKLHLLGPDAKLRPFLGGGAAYSKSFVNYDGRILAVLNQAGLGYLGRDYEISSFLGSISSGFDVRVTKSVSIGAVFKYYTVLSARENQNLNNLALYGSYPSYGYNPYSAYYGALPDADKQMLGGSLAQAGFYTIQGGATFTF